MKMKEINGIKYDENSLYEVIELSMSVSRKLEKLEVYASLLCDEDTSINKNQELKEDINKFSIDFEEIKIKATICKYCRKKVPPLLPRRSPGLPGPEPVQLPARHVPRHLRQPCQCGQGPAVPGSPDPAL